MKRIIVILASLLMITSCNNQTSDNTKDPEVYEKQNAKLAEQNRILSEQQTLLQQQLEEQKYQKELEKLAENEPVIISNFKIENCTGQGTLLNSGGLYDINKVKFIRWTVDYIDNVVKAGGKTYGTFM